MVKNSLLRVAAGLTYLKSRKLLSIRSCQDRIIQISTVFPQPKINSGKLRLILLLLPLHLLLETSLLANPGRHTKPSTTGNTGNRASCSKLLTTGNFVSTYKGSRIFETPCRLYIKSVMSAFSPHVTGRATCRATCLCVRQV